MALDITIPSALEQQLEQAAQYQGLSTETYALQLLEQSLQLITYIGQPRQPLTVQELATLQPIAQRLAAVNWTHYRLLQDKATAGSLTPEEHQTLLAMADHIEALNLERIEALSKLASDRGRSIATLIEELDLAPHQNVGISH